MKKIVALLLVLSMQSPMYASYMDKQLKDAKKNAKYNTVQTHQKNYYNVLPTSSLSAEIKDPKLIKISDAKPVNKDLYSKKLKKDEAVYGSTIKNALNKKTSSINIEPDSVDFYNVYRITERLIRANSLDYVNWRVAIRKSEDFNAAAFEGNYILINTALYDTFYDNADALAFVIAHEMAHHIFGHSQRKIEREKETDKFKNYTLLLLYGAPIAWLVKDKMNLKEDKLMEYMADAEAMKLLTTAGYSPEKAMEALHFMESLPNVEDFWGSHPIPKKRIESIKESFVFADPNWSEIGKNNIYNSDVLGCKKSSDRVSIVINKSKKPDGFYEPEDPEKLLTRMAYMSYRNGKMENAAKYFRMLAKQKDDYIPYLYCSYANQYLYNQTKDSKYLNRAAKSIKRAKELAGDDRYVIEQVESVENL